MNSKKKRSPLYEVWLRLRVQPMAMVTLSGIIILILVAIFADVIADYNGMALMQVPANKLLPPSAEHIFGTDNFGRDMFARIVHGARIAVLISFTSVIFSTTVGIILACSATLFGGKVDMVIMRVIDVLSAIPNIVIALSIVAGLGAGVWQLVVAMGISSIPMPTRMIRSKAISIVNMEYIESAKALGAKTPHIITNHLVPNLISIILVVGTSQIAGAIMTTATLSFLGLGVTPPAPEWGLMLNDGMTYMRRDPHMVYVPGAAVLLTSLCVAIFGDFLRDAFDPQLKGRI
ncbi:MAG: ABC transporter permease [Clostridiales bacterium]|nr:ABC transporter permease [Bacteroidales bacterium]NLO49505.1 ABC transporter permease [Clostridiales bacterium]